jgi:hypothetical protein
MMILISGPYRGGTGDDSVLMARNLERLESVALPLFRAGHIPVIGEWFALPLVKLAGSRTVGDAAYQEISYPIAHRLIERCDAILRLPGESKGADADVNRANARGIPVYRALNEIPGIEAIAEPQIADSRDYLRGLHRCAQ